jgi:membrane protein
MQRFISALREAGLRFSRDGCAFLAQSVAFNALFALFPLVVLVIAAASYVYPQAEERVLAFFDEFSPTLHAFVAANLESYIYGRGISSIIALVFLIWSAKNLFLALAYALDRALGVPKGRPLVHDILLSIVMLPIMAISLIVAMGLPVVLSLVMAATNVPDRQNLTHLGAYLLSIVLVFVACMVLYRFLPNRHMSKRFSFPGALLVACLWPVLQFAFTEYTLRVDFTHIYGALSAPLVLLFWFYCMGSVFLYGAEFCTAWAAQHGDVHIPLVVDVLDVTIEQTTVEN